MSDNEYLLGHLEILEAKIFFVQLDLTNVQRHRKKYDAVVSMDVIEHFPKSKMHSIAAAYSNLVAPNSFAVIGTPNVFSAPYASARGRATHIHEFEREEYRDLFSKHFKNVFMFSMTDEVVSTSFDKLAWHLMAVCTKG